MSVDTADITVVIPTIPPRVGDEGLLMHAVHSVKRQTLTPAGGISCALDVGREGAAVTRQRALDAVRTEWVAFLDDDDIWYPHHLETLWQLAKRTGASYVWSWFDGNNPFPMHRGRQMNVDNPHHTTMNVMVRTELARAAGFINHPQQNDAWPGEDWNFTLRCIDILRARHHGDVAATNAEFAGSPDITWHYRVHRGNTSGLPSRW
jgi:glycosyltransferase involved in cell wall biosynthesis